MIARAREISPHLAFDVASATSLPVETASIQVAASITVIHHLEHRDQDAAVAELARVVKPGGNALVIALLDTIPGGAWCYSHSRKDWLDLFQRYGFRPRLVLGEEYISPAILFGAAASAVAKSRRGQSVPDDPSAVAGSGLARTVLRGAHRCAVAVSYPVEATLQRLPGTFGATGLAVTLVRQ
jgi:SAM-dependent methyltransferase